MIRFIEFLDNIFGRINSKRLMIYYGFLLFLAYAYSKNASELIICIAGLATAVAWLLFFMPTPDDKLAMTKATMPETKVTTATALLLVGMLALAGSAAAAFDEVKDLYYQPTKAERAKDPQQIQAQQRFYRDAVDSCKETGNVADCARASDLALWPVQRAWLLNNRALDLFFNQHDDLASLHYAETMLEKATELCADEDELTGGPDGAKVCIVKVQDNLAAVRERILELNKTRPKLKAKHKVKK